MSEQTGNATRPSLTILTNQKQSFDDSVRESDFQRVRLSESQLVHYIAGSDRTGMVSTAGYPSCQSGYRSCHTSPT